MSSSSENLIDASKWKNINVTIKDNRCCSGVLLIVMIIFLSAFIFLTCAYFKTPKVSSNKEISPAQNVSNKTRLCNNTSIERNRTSERICTSSDCVRAASYLIESMDLKVDPCEDFYEFACGNWKNYHGLYVGWADIVSERIGNAIEHFLKSKSKANESKVILQSRIMYKSCMNLNTDKKQINDGKLELKRQFKKYCFPNIHIFNSCTFDWNVTLTKLCNEYTCNWTHSLDINYIQSQAFAYDVKYYLLFIQPNNIYIDADQIVKNIQEATNIIYKIPENSMRGQLKIMHETYPKSVQMILWWMVLDTLVTKIRSDYNIHYRDITISKSEFCAGIVNENMGMFLSDAIEIPNFFNSTKPKVFKVFENIRSIFSDLVENSDWMDKETKKAVIEKSMAIKLNVGFGESLLNQTKVDEYLKDLNLTKDSLVDNESTVQKIRRNLISKSINNRELLFGVATDVNAFYYRALNSLIIPMGFLQFPFYGLGIEALNYGSSMSTLGHEFTHAFDNTGRMYDKNGILSETWKNSTKNEYINRTNCLIEQYNNFNLSDIDPTFNGSANGVNTLGENIADNVGLSLVYKAYKMFVAEHGEEELLPIFDKFTHEQLLFIAYGNTWCQTVSPKALGELKNDGHSFRKFRVNGAVSNLKEFREAFKCNATSKMVSKKPCHIW